MTYLALPGPTELYVILLVVLLLFGAKKLPQLARSMGSSITQFKKGLKESPDLLDEADDPAEAAKDVKDQS